MKLPVLSSLLLLATTVASQTPPSQDPFYQQPSNIASYANGAVISSRPIATRVANAGTVVDFKAAYQYLYRTTDSLNNPIAAVTTLLVPKNADTTKLMSWSFPYDSTDINCSPSYTLNSTYTGRINELQSRGWYVVLSDYEGLNAQFTADPISGRATLDSIRAVFNQATSNGISKSAKVGIGGYSGGSLAAGWGIEVQPSYASELNLIGAALGGTVPNLTNALLTINKGPGVALAFRSIVGLGRAFPDFKSYVDSHLVAATKNQFYANGQSGCGDNSSSISGSNDIFTYFTNGRQFLYDSVPANLLSTTGQMGPHGTPKIPVYIYKAIVDEVSPVADTDQLYNLYCSEGVNVEYHKDSGVDHIAEDPAGTPAALIWLDHRFKGDALSHSSCVTVAG